MAGDHWGAPARRLPVRPPAARGQRENCQMTRLVTRPRCCRSRRRRTSRRGCGAHWGTARSASSTTRSASTGQLRALHPGRLIRRAAQFGDTTAL
ncbi:hypothetical protein HBB16_10955 [Pseudonocardia sp. MCCB 268]|nr:hypothetical protein [Pseudonocardia cytotoxica]